MARTMTGAEIVIKALQDQGVEHIFGYPGGAVLPIYDELFQQEKIQHVLVRQEGGALHAAEGYARSTDKVGVALVTSGPGATNAVTGLTDALMDSIPLVCITGQVPTHLIGNDAFQECDTVGITRPCTKHNWLVKNVNDLARVIHEAFYIAKAGRPGRRRPASARRAARGAAADRPHRQRYRMVGRRRRAAALRRGDRRALLHHAAGPQGSSVRRQRAAAELRRPAAGSPGKGGTALLSSFLKRSA